MKDLGRKLFLKKKFSPKPPFKKTLIFDSGNAYIAVVIASLAVLSLVLTALTITARSRDLTGRYGNVFGLFDLAVAEHGQALYALQNGNLPTHFERHRYTRYWIPVEEWDWQREWSLLLDFPNASDDRHDFRGRTEIFRRTGGYRIVVRVWRYENYFAHATVHSIVNYLDDYTLEMVELARIAN